MCRLTYEFEPCAEFYDQKYVSLQRNNSTISQCWIKVYVLTWIKAFLSDLHEQISMVTRLKTKPYTRHDSVKIKSTQKSTLFCKL